MLTFYIVSVILTWAQLYHYVFNYSGDEFTSKFTKTECLLGNLVITVIPMFNIVMCLVVTINMIE